MRVPVGTRTLVGCVVGHDAAIADGTEARDVAAILDEEPFLPPAIVDLCRWVADYYLAGFGDAIARGDAARVAPRRMRRRRSASSPPPRMAWQAAPA